VVVIVASGAAGLPRVGVVAGAKKVGGAVQRNRTKRRLREALLSAPLREGYDYVVIASRSVLTAPLGEVERWLLSAVGEETSDG
jgi:ribonuclease P protein component